jgi:hypothetical protein
LAIDSRTLSWETAGTIDLLKDLGFISGKTSEMMIAERLE